MVGYRNPVVSQKIGQDAPIISQWILNEVNKTGIYLMYWSYRI